MEKINGNKKDIFDKLHENSVGCFVLSTFALAMFIFFYVLSSALEEFNLLLYILGVLAFFSAITTFFRAFSLLKRNEVTSDINILDKEKE